MNSWSDVPFIALGLLVAAIFIGDFAMGVWRDNAWKREYRRARRNVNV